MYESENLRETEMPRDLLKQTCVQKFLGKEFTGNLLPHKRAINDVQTCPRGISRRGKERRFYINIKKM